MYNTKYDCRYFSDDVFLETDEVSEDEKEFIRDCLYKEDLLNIFNIDDSDELDVLSNVILDLYKKINTCEGLMECMRLAAARLISEDKEIGLCLLYSYDYMYLTHKCVRSFLENGEIIESDLKNLKSKLI